MALASKVRVRKLFGLICSQHEHHHPPQKDTSLTDEIEAKKEERNTQSEKMKTKTTKKWIIADKIAAHTKTSIVGGIN